MIKSSASILSIFTFLTILFILISCESEQISNNPILWYMQPAAIWDEALPVGNGRLGAMVFGKVYNERIQLNEESLWAGERIDTNNPNALLDLPKIRQLIFDGRIKEAYKLGNKSLLGTPPRLRSYQTLGDMIIEFDSTAEKRLINAN